MEIELSWYLLLPPVMSAIYGVVETRCLLALGFAGRGAFLTTAALTTLWAAIGFPLPVFYVLAYLLRQLRYRGGDSVRRSRFLLNLGYVNTLALHLILIGAVALARDVTMETLLESGFWRALSVSVLIAANAAEGVLFLRYGRLSAALTEVVASTEGRPFMAFLWFCTGYLLADSLLCAANLEALYPPLFLIGSSALLMFLLIRFLLHIHAIIRNHHLRDEHDRLAAELEEKVSSTGTLKQLTDRDALTGAFSRRYAMRRISSLMEAGEVFSLIFLDLDRLKQINDREGHDAGDRYLSGFSRALGARLRDGDILARVGGDEFVVLMPGCEGAVASRRMQSIRAAVETEKSGDTAFRFSYGIADLPPGVRWDAEELIREADRAMYQDKRRRL